MGREAGGRVSGEGGGGRQRACKWGGRKGGRVSGEGGGRVSGEGK